MPDAIGQVIGSWVDPRKCLCGFCKFETIRNDQFLSHWVSPCVRLLFFVTATDADGLNAAQIAAGRKDVVLTNVILNGDCVSAPVD